MITVLELVDVHEHGARGIGGVRDKDILRRTAVQLVDEPGVDGTKCKVAALVYLLHFGDVLEEPEELGNGGVCTERLAADVHQLVAAWPRLELVNDGIGTGVSPDNGVVEGFAGLAVPDNGGFALVGDTDGLDAVDLVASRGELLNCFVYAGVDRGDNLFWVVLVPSLEGQLCALTEFKALKVHTLGWERSA